MAHELDEVRMGEKPHWTPEDIVGNMSLGTLLFSNDYRHIALKGILTSLVLLGVGGAFAMIFRTELMVLGAQNLGHHVITDRNRQWSYWTLIVAARTTSAAGRR